MPVSPRGRRQEALDRIYARIEDHRQQELVHTPPWGSIGLGGTDYMFSFKRAVGEAYLRVACRTRTPEAALEEVMVELDKLLAVGKSEAETVHLWFVSLS